MDLTEKDKIFISHSSKDKSFASRIATDLQLAGGRIWLDDHEILPGDRLTKAIVDGIKQSSFFLLVLSPNSLSSLWVKKELDAANEAIAAGSKLEIVPLRYQECELPAAFKDTSFADFSDFTKEDKYFISLNKIKKKLKLALTETNREKAINLPDMERRLIESVLHDIRPSLELIKNLADRSLAKHQDKIEPGLQDVLTDIWALAGQATYPQRQYQALLAFQKGKYPLQRQELHPNVLLRALIQQFRPHQRASGVKIVFSEADYKIPPFRGDRELIEIALRNLLDNAVKYSLDNHQVTVLHRLEKTSHVISITNIGYPIVEDELPFLFKRGWRSQAAFRSHKQGLGLGLHLANLIASAHGGSLTYRKSFNPKEVTFDLRLPLKY